jgi:predicted metallo-beta-lactamase superfamily hydrolase
VAEAGVWAAEAAKAEVKVVAEDDADSPAGSIEIIGTESLGVRGLSCLVHAGDRRIFIDPGIALGYLRHGLLPHPVQVAQGERMRQRILAALTTATDVVFSHFHGDHIPLRDANPYQLAIGQLPANFHKISCWSKSQGTHNGKMKQRTQDLKELLGVNFHDAENHTDGCICFSKAVLHGGGRDPGRDGVMMTRIDLGDAVFVHASDIQLLDAATIHYIIAWQPDIVLAAGPPLYLQTLSPGMRKLAWANGLRLAQNIKTLILDHHLMRGQQGPLWLADLSAAAGRKVYCAADFMGCERLLLEAERVKLYGAMPVSSTWHDEYAKGVINADYQSRE